MQSAGAKRGKSKSAVCEKKQRGNGKKRKAKPYTSIFYLYFYHIEIYDGGLSYMQAILCLVQKIILYIKFFIVIKKEARVLAKSEQTFR